MKRVIDITVAVTPRMPSWPITGSNATRSRLSIPANPGAISV